MSTHLPILYLLLNDDFTLGLLQICTENFIKCKCMITVHFDCLSPSFLPKEKGQIKKSTLNILSSPYFKFNCKTCIVKPIDELTSKINDIHDVVCIKKTYATVAAPSIDIAKISHTMN